MALQFVVYVAIPDEEILEAQEFAESLCTRLGGSCDWQFHDSERVVYWFTKAEAWDAFRAHCAVREWNLAEQEGRLITGSLSVQQSRRPTSPRARRGHRREEGGQTITDETKGAAPRRRRRAGRGGRPKRQRPEVPLGDAALGAGGAISRLGGCCGPGPILACSVMRL
jgi:hypothetical protein